MASLDCVSNSVINAKFFFRGNNNAKMAMQKLKEVDVKFEKLGNVGPFARGLNLRL